MRTLILGGTGMLGRALAAETRRRGWAALALSHAHADLSDRERLLYWVDSFRPQLVVNCAAFTRVDDAEKQRDLAMEINGRAVAHVAAAAAAVDARMIQVSSDYVFDGRARAPYSEDAATAPLSAYGESKALGEREALRYERALVVRASWLFGAGGPNFVATIVRLLRERQGGAEPLRVVDDQVGCPTYTPFLARALCDLAGKAAAGILHYRNREPVSWHGFACEIARECGSTLEVQAIATEDFPRPAARPAYSTLDVARCERLLGRRVEPWSWGLADYIHHL